ncbi:MAG TPA: GntR family transcriptional regulator [Thermoleophilaceae bacterium]
MAHSPDFPAFELDRDSGLPLGTQLGWRLRTLIAAGRLAEGERLPAVREMAALAGVNVNTVRSVLSRLADEGVIVSEHGRGTFVASAAAAEAGLARVRSALGAEPAAPRGTALRAEPAADEPSPTSREASAEARRRASLRAEIALLERELAALEPGNGGSGAGPPHGGSGTASTGRPAPQLLTSAQLEAIRDRLVDRLQPLRADRTVVRGELERERHEPAPGIQRQRAIASSAPRFETGPSGGWSLRWRG